MIRLDKGNPRFTFKVKIEPQRDFTIGDFESEVKERPSLGLFVWTLTHSVPMFNHIGPSFEDRRSLVTWTLAEVNRQPRQAFAAPWSTVHRLALDKIRREWEAWLKLTEVQPNASEKTLDNLLMQILYPMIRSRDGNKCVMCGTTGKLVIHHIVGKGRLSKRPPPFGRSAPTNLVTLCSGCHAAVDGYASVAGQD